MRRFLASLIAFVLVGAAAAPAAVKRAESILPPGQSGFVSTTGVTSGTGSPHLYDQQPLFIDLRRKNALFNQPGKTETPKAGVKIVRDTFGVPAVTGDTEANLWFGAGYAVAQDRLFELELFRRATTGRLAEILGADFLDDDLIARRDYYTPAELDAMLAGLPAELRARFDGYRDGINAWIAHVRQTPADQPGEYAALNAPLVDWTVRDSAAVGVFLARTVPSGDGAELQNLDTLRKVGTKAFDQLLPLRVARQLATIPRSEGVFPSQPGRTVKQERAGFRASIAATKDFPLAPEGSAAARTARANVAPGLPGAVGGSFMIAVRNRKAKSAVFFNAPQLGFAVPELFVEIELHGPGIDVRGGTAPGVPVIGTGHNGQLAFGVTSGLSDEDDLYADQLVGDTKAETYRFKGEERKMDCREERFDFASPPPTGLSAAMKALQQGRGTKTERICRTVHGPVQLRVGGTAYARRYAIWGRELETLEGLAMLNAAKTVKDADAAMQKVTWNENVIAADSEGNIGYWHPGLHPLRPKGFDERLPYPGTGEAEWRGLLDRRKTPHVINPKQGWLANWNNIPSDGWTSGDAPATERLGGPYHRSGWLFRLTRNLAKAKTIDFAGAEQVLREAGTVAQQRPLAQSRLRKAAKGSTGPAKDLLGVLLAWDGSYHRVDASGTVDPGVAAWEAFKDSAETIMLSKLGGAAARNVAGENGRSHEFDASNGEALALRTLGPEEYRQAAVGAFDTLVARFKTRDVAKWRDPRKMYMVTAQGAGQAPPLPFFDRGTFESVVEVGP